MDYKETLLMPKTEFQMKGNLPENEAIQRAKWEEMDLYNKVREKIVSEYKLNYTSFIHPKSIIAEDVKIGEGCVVMAGAVINSGSLISDHVIVNTSVSIDHDSKIDDFAHLSPGVHMGGTVKIGKRSWIGVGSSVKNNITICEDVTVGVGGVVVKDIKEEGIYIGSPVKKLNKCME